LATRWASPRLAGSAHRACRPRLKFFHAG
jgi:hypothetical protein